MWTVKLKNTLRSKRENLNANNRICLSRIEFDFDKTIVLNDTKCALVQLDKIFNHKKQLDMN